MCDLYPIHIPGDCPQPHPVPYIFHQEALRERDEARAEAERLRVEVAAVDSALVTANKGESKTARVDTILAMGRAYDSMMLANEATFQALEAEVAPLATERDAVVEAAVAVQRELERKPKQLLDSVEASLVVLGNKVRALLAATRREGSTTKEDQR